MAKERSPGLLAAIALVSILTVTGWFLLRAVEVDESQAVELLLAQGEMSLHHIKVVHGSRPNRSDGPCILFSIRYVAPHVCPPEPLRRATLVRGHGLYGYFEPDPVPTRDMEPEIVAFVDSPDGRPCAANGKG